jgi:GNAT superfamily N-acetyltransferase
MQGFSEMTEGLELRSGYFADRQSFLALAGLLQDVFDIDIGLLDRFGGPDLTAMPFGYFDTDGRCVANFSAFSMPVVVDNRLVRAAGYQSGAVRPDYRGRGLYRDLMQRAFAWAEAEGFEAHVLLTDKPDLYRPYGFETVPQHAFRGPMPLIKGMADCRPLSLDDASDLALVTAILEARCDVSERFSVRRQTKTFLLNACFDPEIRLSHLAELDAIIAWKVGEGTLRLLDVAAREMPDLAAIVGALGVDPATVEVLFPPDRLGWEGDAVPYRGSCDLMVRAGSANPVVPTLPFMLTASMEF